MPTLTEIAGEGPNTAFHYTYRDVANYKQHSQVVFSGAITLEQLEQVRANLPEGRLFCPDDVGLDEIRFSGTYDDDPDWHEADRFRLTFAAPTDGALADFVEAMTTARWTPPGEVAQRERLGGLYTSVLVVLPKAPAAAFLDSLTARADVLFAAGVDGVAADAVAAGADPTSWPLAEVIR